MALAAFICQHVFDETKPILMVCHHGDGDWEFLCGGTHRGEIPKVVCIDHLWDRDATLSELMSLPHGWAAERQSPSAPWELSPLEEEAD